MPRLPGWAWLLLAIGFATLASYMALGWLKRQAAVQPPKAKTTIVVVAKIAVAPTSLLSAEQLKTEVWHQEKPPPGSFNNLEQVVGRVTATLYPARRPHHGKQTGSQGGGCGDHRPAEPQPAGHDREGGRSLRGGRLPDPREPGGRGGGRG